MYIKYIYKIVESMLKTNMLYKENCTQLSNCEIYSSVKVLNKMLCIQ